MVMHRLLFQNRFNALAFVAVILFGVMLLVGSEGDEGAIEKVAQDFTSSKAADEASQPRGEEEAPPGSQPIATAFTPDEELVDDTAGLDPSGWSAEPDVDEGPGLEVPEILPQETGD